MSTHQTHAGCAGSNNGLQYSSQLSERLLNDAIVCADISRSFEEYLENPGPHAGKTYPLFGPKEYTFPEAFAEIGHIFGREVRYQTVPLNVWQERIAMRWGSFLAQHIVEVAKDHTVGVFSGTNHVVKEITGKEPIGLAEFVENNKQCFEVDSSVAAGTGRGDSN